MSTVEKWIAFFLLTGFFLFIEIFFGYSLGLIIPLAMLLSGVHRPSKKKPVREKKEEKQETFFDLDNEVEKIMSKPNIWGNTKTREQAILELMKKYPVEVVASLEMKRATHNGVNHSLDNGHPLSV